MSRTVVVLVASLVAGGCGQKLKKEVELIERNEARAAEAARDGNVGALATSVGTLYYAPERLKRMGEDKIRDQPAKEYLAEVRKGVGKSIVRFWDKLGPALKADDNTYHQQRLREYFEGSGLEAEKKLKALFAELAARPRVLVRCASSIGAESFVKKLRKKYPELSFRKAEGRRTEDAKKKFDLYLGFEESKLSKADLIRYQKTKNGRKDGPARYAIGAYGLQLTAKLSKADPPEGVEHPLVLRRSQKIDNPTSFAGRGRSSATARMARHQANALSAASSKLQMALALEALTALAPALNDHK